MYLYIIIYMNCTVPCDIIDMSYSTSLIVLISMVINIGNFLYLMTFKNYIKNLVKSDTTLPLPSYQQVNDET